jgi:hypothetical protein
MGSVPGEVIGLINCPNPSTRTMALGLTQPLTEISITNFPGGKRQLVHKADNHTTICEAVHLTVFMAFVASNRGTLCVYVHSGDTAAYHSSIGEIDVCAVFVSF